LYLQKKRKLAAVAVVFLLSFAAFVAVAPLTKGDVTGTSASYCFLAVTPNPVGVGQTVHVGIIMWIPPPTAVVNTGDRWQGLKVTITRPDGETETKGPFTGDAVGNAWFDYTPTQLGVYKFQAHFPGQRLVGMAQILFGPPVPIDVQYQASDSNVVELTVQSQPAPAVQLQPLPSSYWTRPINAQNYAWDSISSNWLMPAWDSTNRQFDQGCAYARYATTPSSAHILWTKPLTFGGLVGGEFGTTAFHNGMSYEQFFKPPVVISGRLYYNTIQAEEPTSTGGGSAGGVNAINVSTVTCVDLATGKTLFTIPHARLDFGQIYDYISPNQGGCFAYLWDTSGGTTWKMYDAWTGNYICSIKNVPAGTILLDNTFNVNQGPGDILVYSLNPATGTLSLWNSTQVFMSYQQNMTSATNSPWTWRIYNWQDMTLDGSTGIMWTKTLADFPAGGLIAQVGYDNTVYVYAGQVTGVLGATAAFSLPQKTTWVGYSMTDGSKLWGPNVIDATQHIPANTTVFPGTFLQARIIGMGPDRGILALFVKDTMQWYAWNVTSGAFLWGPTKAYTNPWGLYNYESQLIANGILYNAGYDGMIHAFDVTTGQELWTFSSGDAGTITPYGTWPFYNGLTLTKNALIGTTGEHGNGVEPLYQGEGIYVVDPVSGKQLWNLTGWFTQPVIADCMLLSHNLYDNQIYAFGKGPSAITVTATAGVGNAVTIQGTVTDQSPGAKQLVEDGKFNIVPAIADTYQSVWMSYLYEQQPLPNSFPCDTAGVQVTLSATDPTGKTIDIGTVTSDASGHFAISWTPPGQGLYTITAAFKGSNSYYASSDETSIAISSTTASSATTALPLDTLIIVATIIIIIVIIIAAVVITRKHS